MKNLFYIFLFCGLSGCETLVNDLDLSKLPVNEDKLVLNSYISPQDTILAVKAHYSDRIFGEFKTNLESNDLKLATNIKVSMSEGNNKLDLLYDSRNKVYTANIKKLPIVAGKTYQLRAEDSKGQVYTATTTVPFSSDFEILNPVIYSSKNNFGNGLYWAIPVKWSARANSFYRIGASDLVETESKLSDGSIQKTIYNSSNISWQSIYLQNPEKITKPLSSQVLYYNNVLGTNTKYIARYISLLVVDENYYKYHKSVQNNNNEGNPFVEPTLLFSNIKNGYGCFGSFNTTDKNFTIN